ncbi:MAG: hypothetical protein FJX71_02215 [Alphaproteobacteria bacterium]|nr:hypothetical protein [Alphaproteobacteria bacterium]
MIHTLNKLFFIIGSLIFFGHAVGPLRAVESVVQRNAEIMDKNSNPTTHAFPIEKNDIARMYGFPLQTSTEETINKKIMLRQKEAAAYIQQHLLLLPPTASNCNIIAYLQDCVMIKKPTMEHVQLLNTLLGIR